MLDVRGTRNPVPRLGARIEPAARDMVITATEAYSTVLRMPAAIGATGARSTAASAAGTATTTPSTRSDSDVPRSPVPWRDRTHRPEPGPAMRRRSMASTLVLVWMVAPRRTRASASCAAKLAVLPERDQKTGDGAVMPLAGDGDGAGGADTADAGDSAGRTRPSRCMRLPGWSDAAISTGMVAAALRSSTSPALMPPISGSTRRSTTGRPSRSPTISPTERSPNTAFPPPVGDDHIPGRGQ